MVNESPQPAPEVNARQVLLLVLVLIALAGAGFWYLRSTFLQQNTLLQLEIA